MLFLTGCQNSNKAMDRTVAVREALLSAQGCTFDAIITADYGETLHVFQMNCQCEADGDMNFTVTYPESISGITGHVRQDSAGITFDGHVLAFEKLADGYISPVSAPWVFLKTLRSGYIRSCSQEDNKISAVIDDSFADDALQLHISFDEHDIPTNAEIIWQNRRILSLEISNYSYL